MKEKRKFTNNSLWWLDVCILNNNNFLFNYKNNNNLFYLNINNSFYYYYYLIMRKNLNTLLFLNSDITTIKSTINKLYISKQSIFCDFKIMLSVNIENKINSVSTIYCGNTWLERELREFYNFFFINLVDSRKLLLNYNYNSSLNYNQFNNIISDINI